MSLLDEVYAAVPDVGCKGLCRRACGPVGCSAIEADDMRDNGVIPPQTRTHPTEGPLTCSHLGDDGRCRIYARRPLVCRLYGAVQAMRCPHGCKPAAGFLADDAARALLHRLADGRPPHVPDIGDFLGVPL